MKSNFWMKLPKYYIPKIAYYLYFKSWHRCYILTVLEHWSMWLGMQAYLYSIILMEQPVILWQSQGLQPCWYGYMFVGHHLLSFQYYPEIRKYNVFLLITFKLICRLSYVFSNKFNKEHIFSHFYNLVTSRINLLAISNVKIPKPLKVLFISDIKQAN